MEFFYLKDFHNSLTRLRRAGGEKKRRAEKVLSVLGSLNLGDSEIRGLSTTNHGESRIRGCVKYNLGSGYRLITIQTKKLTAFCFVGTHAEVDHWLDEHKGLTISKGSSGAWEPIYKSPSADQLIGRAPEPSSDKLVDRIDSTYLNRLFEGLPPQVLIKLAAFGSIVTGAEIEALCTSIHPVTKRGLVHDVLCLLASGDRYGAASRLDLEFGDATPGDNLSDQEMLEVTDGDEIKRLKVGSPEHERWLAQFAKEAEPMEWLLFLHPEQAAVVDADFSGPAQLSGVSGSGKTCVAIHRALRLAAEEPRASVLIVTLNRSLAGLIEKLVDGAAPNQEVRATINVSSFFQLCQSFLEEYEPRNRKLYSDVTWKLNEHIDEIFREYYRCWLNNNTAECVLPIHQSLVSQGICGETYTREEFDWIRSAMSASSREEYLGIDRHGRRVPLQEEARSRMLEALAGWETKMRDVGVIDYLGLTTALSRHVDEIEPRYDHVIVDEAQDFGTSELQVLRRLCRDGHNDMFLCGDIAQHVLPKHRVLSEAGISTSGRARRIVRNYRNSREILRAAYEVLIANLDVSQLDSSDFEILDPKYASRSSSEPVVLEAESIDEEIGYARSYAAEYLAANQSHRCCITLAGYSARDVEQFGQRLGLRVLRGERSPIEEGLVLSDLEQIKGYEFNVVIIVNCQKGVLPPEGTPVEEAFRHGCRLYVAMTRARDELYLSFSGQESPWLQRTSDALSFMQWKEVVELKRTFVSGSPKTLEEAEGGNAVEVLRLKGRDFLYTSEARGLSLEAVRKIDELVDGVGLISKRQRVRWRDMKTLMDDLERQPKARQLFGPVVGEEVRRRLIEIRDSA